MRTHNICFQKAKIYAITFTYLELRRITRKPISDWQNLVLHVIAEWAYFLKSEILQFMYHDYALSFDLYNQAQDTRATMSNKGLLDTCATKIQISLRIRAVWSESSLAAFWIAMTAKFLYANNEDSDLTARLRMLIWVFVGRIRVCQSASSDTLRVECVLWTRWHDQTFEARIWNIADKITLLNRIK